MGERADDSTKWILRRAAKAAVAGVLSAAGAHHVVRLLRRREAGGSRVLILSYHRVTPDFGASAREGLASLLVSVDTLRRQIELVSRRSDVVSLADARRILAERPGRAARDVVAVTLDDGYADVAEHALPMLAALRVPASVFVPTGYVGTDRRLPHDRLHAALSTLIGAGIPLARAGLGAPLQALLDGCAADGAAATLDRLISRLPHDALVAIADALEARLGRTERDLPAGTRLMSWDQVRALHAAGMDVGGHTVNHVALANVPLAQARKEIAGCAATIEERVGTRPRHFAYPNGYYTPAVRRAVADAGFEAAVTIEDEENRRGGDPYALKRKVLWENTTKGALGWSRAVATCNVGGVFAALGLAHPVPGERSDAPDASTAALDPGGTGGGGGVSAQRSAG